MKMTKTVFLGGLPRSGSTLLNNLLGQHPDISVSGTSGLAGLVTNIRSEYTIKEEFKSNSKEQMDNRIRGALAGLIAGWSLSDTDIFIDKGRGWLPMIPLLRDMYDTSLKVIVPIRDLRGVFASMERLYRNNNLRIDPVKNSNINNSITVEERYHQWANSLPVGISIGQLKDLLDRRDTQDILFIKMEELTLEPQIVINNIYKYLEIDPVDIQFPVYNLSKEDDRVYGIDNLHTTTEDSIIKCSTDYEEVLGKHVCDNILLAYSWFYETLYPEIKLNQGI